MIFDKKMKKSIAILLSILLFMMQSCTSYKNFDLKKQEIVDGKTYKIAKYSTFTKIKVISVVDSVLTYKIGQHQQQIHLRDIKRMKYKKINSLKTAAMVTGVATIALFVALSTISMNIKGAPINFPSPQ